MPDEKPRQPADNSSFQESELAAAITQTILGKPILVFISVVCFVLIVAVHLLVVFTERQFTTPFEQMAIFSLLSVCLSIFFWIFFPQLIEVRDITIPELGWRISKLAGPLVMYVLLLSVFRVMFVSPAPQSRYYSLEGPNGGVLIPSHLLKLKYDDTTGDIVKVRGENGTDVIGLLVHFANGRSFDVELYCDNDEYFSRKSFTALPALESSSITLEK